MEQLLLFILLNFMGAMSPGPDFAMVMRYGMSGSLRASLLATLGISLALVIHALYCLLGVALFLKNTPLYFHLIQSLGACYLAYRGLSMMHEGLQKKVMPSTKASNALAKRAFMDGFLTNLTNPKAMIFLLSLFTQFVSPQMSWPMKLAFGLSMPLVAFTWFGLLSVLLTHPRFYEHLRHYQFLLTLTMGILLTGLSSYILWTSYEPLAALLRLHF